MIREKLFEDLFDKIPENKKCVIFGACDAGKKILSDIKKYRPDCVIKGFIENYNKVGSFYGLPVWTLKEFTQIYSPDDIVIMATKNGDNTILNILDLYNIPAIRQTAFVFDYYRDKNKILSEENFKNIIDIFESLEDRELFELIFKARLNIIDFELVKNYFYTNVANKYKNYCNYGKHYLDKINKNVVKIVFDLGLNDGINVIAYNKKLPNLQKVYGFEAIYDVTRIPFLEELILNDKLEIIPIALGDSNKKINFNINKKETGRSFGDEIAYKRIPENSQDWECRTVDVSTIDNFCMTKNIFPDLIKMDIEGAELAALKGGIETIKKCRPQLAISIYHQEGKDFINIPLYLKENLENYKFRLGHYAPALSETVFYAIPDELVK